MVYVAVFSIALLLYAFFGFPMIIGLLAKARPRRWKRDDTYQPRVSIVLPIYNEELILRQCLSAIITQNYPSDKVEILCGSDGSTDQTNAILEDFSSQYSNLRPFFFPNRRGKMMVMNDLVREAQNEILFFTDADVVLGPDWIRYHVSNYVDSEVGGVTGPLRFETERKDGTTLSEAGFLEMECQLRRNEALIYSSTGFYGCNWSMRRENWKDLPSQTTCDDLYEYLAVIDKGKRLVYDERAIATEIYGRSYQDEFSRKTRYAARSLDAVSHFPQLLFRWPAAAFLWPRKMLRWLTFVPITVLITAITMGVFRHESWSYVFATIGIVSLSLVFVGWLGRNLKHNIPIASQLFWFTQMNIAFLRGVYEFLFSRQSALWPQTTRYAGSPSAVISDQKTLS